MYSCVFVCIRVYSCVFVCIRVYSCVFVCVLVSSFVFVFLLFPSFFVLFAFRGGPGTAQPGWSSPRRPIPRYSHRNLIIFRKWGFSLCVSSLNTLFMLICLLFRCHPGTVAPGKSSPSDFYFGTKVSFGLL